MWAGAMIVLLIAAAMPNVVNTVQNTVEWLGAGPEYAADIPGTLFLTVLSLIPFALLAAQVVWSARTRRGIPVVTAACVLVAAAAGYGYWVVATDESSTAALIFIVVIPVQWGMAFISGLVLVILNSTKAALAQKLARKDRLGPKTG